MKRIALLLLLLPLALHAAPEWKGTLSPAEPGDFPAPRELKASYRFGWLRLPAGAADVELSKPRRDTLQIEASGGTTGVARKIWKLDATHKATAQISTLHPLRMKQVEDYGWRTITTTVAFSNDGATSLRSIKPPDPVPEGEKKITLPGMYDLLTALLYVRSQRLKDDDIYRIVVYPAKTPYLATIRVLGREKIEVRAGNFNAVKFDVHLQRINTELELEPYKKVKRAVAWLSDDSDRILLRTEAEIFVGSVWAELQSVKYEDREQP